MVICFIATNFYNSWRSTMYIRMHINIIWFEIFLYNHLVCTGVPTADNKGSIGREEPSELFIPFEVLLNPFFRNHDVFKSLLFFRFHFSQLFFSVFNSYCRSLDFALSLFSLFIINFCIVWNWLLAVHCNTFSVNIQNNVSKRIKWFEYLSLLHSGFLRILQGLSNFLPAIVLLSCI